MKKINFITVMILLFANTVLAQKNFKWDIKDSTTKNKDQIYSKTKMYIGETWKSAKDVIQNDDKDEGVILIKALSIQKKYFQMSDHNWTFSYTLKFMMKDNKYRLIIEDVKCVSADCNGNKWPLIEPCDDCEFPGYMKTSLNKERYTDLLSSLKKELQSIVDGYQKHLAKAETNGNGDW